MEIIRSLPMGSRYFIQTLRRLFRVTSSYIPSTFPTRYHLLTSIGTATLISGAIYHSLPSKSVSHSFILHAKSLEKDLSYHGTSIFKQRINYFSFLIEKELFQAAHDGHVDTLKRFVLKSIQNCYIKYLCLD